MIDVGWYWSTHSLQVDKLLISRRYPTTWAKKESHNLLDSGSVWDQVNCVQKTSEEEGKEEWAT